MDKSNGEKPFDCAKDNETREVLEQWDYTLTEKLLEERAAEIARLRNAHERTKVRALITGPDSNRHAVQCLTLQ